MKHSSDRKHSVRNAVIVGVAATTTALASAEALKMVNAAETPTIIQVEYAPSHKTEIDVRLGSIALNMPQPTELILPERAVQIEMPDTDKH